jgi:triphosphatase
LRWLAQTLAPVRNLDVFAASLVRPVTQTLSTGLDFERIIDATERRRRAALAQAKQAIESERYTESMLRLLRWFAARGWRDQQISEHALLLLARIVDVAPDLIERHHRKACKRSKKFDELTATQRHRLRIALKRRQLSGTGCVLRFDRNRVRTFVKCLESWQHELGYANDVRVAYDLVDQISEATNQDTRAIDRAGGIVLGWHERVLVDLNPQIGKHVRRFRRLDPFW